MVTLFSALEALINTALEKESSHNGGALIDQKNEEHVTHKYRYPAKIKIAPGTPTRWVLVDTGHHQVALLNDHGSELQRYGSGESGFTDGIEGIGSFNGPEGICCSGHTIYIADTRNHAIRCIDLESGRITTLAGTGERGMPLMRYWNKSRHVALASPWDVELVGDRLFFANAGTHQLGEIRLGDGCVRLAAGNGREGIHDGPGPQAQLAQPSGLAYDSDTNLLYFVDSETSSIRCLDLQNRWVKTLIGKGLFVFGDSTGSYDESRLQHPLGLAYCAGKLYIADTYNSTIKIVNLNQRVVTHLDSGNFECMDPLCISLIEPAGVACAAENRLLVADTNNHRIVEYSLDTQSSQTWSPLAPQPEELPMLGARGE
jgi:sugar lactone lactonase YvrE